jgi:hypothetical protein
MLRLVYMMDTHANNHSLYHCIRKVVKADPDFASVHPMNGILHCGRARRINFYMRICGG